MKAEGVKATTVRMSEVAMAGGSLAPDDYFDGPYACVWCGFQPQKLELIEEGPEGMRCVNREACADRAGSKVIVQRNAKATESEDKRDA